MTESTSTGRGRGRTRRAAGRPSGEPAATTAVQFTEPAPVADAPARDTGQGRSDRTKAKQDQSQQGKNHQDSGQKDSGQKDSPSGGSRGRGRGSSSAAKGRSSSGDQTGGQGSGGQKGGRGRSGRGRGRVDASTAEFGGVKTMQGGDMTVRLPRPPKPRKGALRMVALGGVTEIGRNMMTFEYDSKVLIVDCGVLFPSSTEPGVDLILPDFGHIEDRLDQVEALVCLLYTSDAADE